MKTNYILLVVLGLTSLTSNARDLQVHNSAERLNYIREAQAWIKPSWINEDFTFSDSLDVFHGAEVHGNDRLLMNDDVYCQVTADSFSRRGGKTRKFYCNLQRFDSATRAHTDVMKGDHPDDIKVKYNFHHDEELFSEVMATRLMWAIGFPVDRMFPVKRVHCYGCTADPYNERHIDPTTLENPREFSPASIERKYDGHNITEMRIHNDGYAEPGNRPGNFNYSMQEAEGWRFNELANLLSNDPAVRVVQRKHRDALRLLMTVLNNWDHKEANQRLVCTGHITDDGRCDGGVALVVQDLGATFGGDANGIGGIISVTTSKFDLQGWSANHVWRDANHCVANAAFRHSTALWNPAISEEGRAFLAKLLVGLSSGEHGRQRIVDIFRAANVDMADRGYTAEAWADALIEKIEQIAYPMGRNNPDFHCPNQIENN